MKFKTQYDSIHNHEIFSTNSGKRFKPTYRLVVDDNGREDLEAVGTVDLYNEIQSHAESVDIHVILDRFQRTGDVSLLNRWTNGVYGDFSEAPKTYAEMYQKVLDAENLFAQLKPEVRAEFNNSPSEFFAAIGTDKFNKYVSSFAEPTKVEVPAVEKGVVENVEKSEQ